MTDQVTLNSSGVIASPQRRLDKVLKILGVIALVEAIILMSVVLFVGARIVTALGDAATAVTDSAPSDPGELGIDPSLDTSEQDFADYADNPGQFCTANPGHVLCP